MPYCDEPVNETLSPEQTRALIEELSDQHGDDREPSPDDSTTERTSGPR